MDVLQAIQNKRAVRSFQQRPLPEDAIRTILNAGRRAQSSKNTQPWQFVAVQERGLLGQLSQTGRYAGHLAGAALGVFILTPDPAQRFSIAFDAGQSAAMQLAAWGLGIGSALASIYQPEEARRLLGFPPDYFVNIAISFGYAADERVMVAPLKKGGRRPLAELVHWEGW